MTIKTFDANRVGGGTFSLVQDPTTGEYKLKEVGFVKLPQLKLPEIDQATAITPVTPTPVTPVTPETPSAPATGGGGGGDGDNQQVDFTGASQFKNIQEEATGGDMMEQATQVSDSLDRSDINQGAIQVEGLREKTAYDKAVSNYNAIAEMNRDLAMGKAPVSSEERLQNKADIDAARNQMDTARQNYEGTLETIKAAPIGDFSAGARTIGDPKLASDKFKYARGPQSVNVKSDKNLIDTAKDVVSSVKSVSIADVISKAASMSPTLSVLKAIGSVNEAANTENTTALRSGGYVTDFQGKIVGKDGKSVNAADSVFGGMNSRSAMGDISKGAQSRIDTISKTISKMTPAQKAKSSLPARKEKFEKELREHNNERVASREDKSGATGKNKGGFTNPGKGSYGPHSGGGGGGGGRNKIVCTMMNESYGFGSFRNKIWLRHSKNLAPEYQRGYHRLFLPLVKKAKTNKILKKILEHIAIHRTIDIRQEERNKIHLIGRIYRNILEPICYWAGKK